jgi:hypothetical protein
MLPEAPITALVDRAPLPESVRAPGIVGDAAMLSVPVLESPREPEVATTALPKVSVPLALSDIA